MDPAYTTSDPGLLYPTNISGLLMPEDPASVIGPAEYPDWLKGIGDFIATGVESLGGQIRRTYGPQSLPTVQPATIGGISMGTLLLIGVGAWLLLRK